MILPATRLKPILPAARSVRNDRGLTPSKRAASASL
jgi:hypothetical protein